MSQSHTQGGHRHDPPPARCVLDVFGAVFFLYATVCHASHLSAFRASPLSFSKDVLFRDVRQFIQVIIQQLIFYYYYFC